jgi:Flp pilus assembly protein TadG
MALVAPLLLVLMFGSVELGNYFMSEHILQKGVRDGAVYAARQNIVDYDCAAGGVAVGGTVEQDTKQLVRTGQLAGGTDRLPLWTDPTTEFNVTKACFTEALDADSTLLGGIYTANGGQVPVVTVTAKLPYRPVRAAFGFSGVGLRLSAEEQATVTGI